MDFSVKGYFGVLRFDPFLPFANRRSNSALCDSGIGIRSLEEIESHTSSTNRIFSAVLKREILGIYVPAEQPLC